MSQIPSKTPPFPCAVVFSNAQPSAVEKSSNFHPRYVSDSQTTFDRLDCLNDEHTRNALSIFDDDELESLAARLRLLSEPDRIQRLLVLADRSGLRATFAAAVSEFPERAKELWSERIPGTGELAVSFLRRVYGPWLQDKLKLADMMTIDKPLWRSLCSWKRDHSDLPADLVAFFESRPDRRSLETDRLLALYGITDASQIDEKIRGAGTHILRRRLKRAFSRRKRPPPTPRI